MNSNGNFVLLIVFCVIGWFYYVTYYLCWFVKEPGYNNINKYLNIFLVEKSGLFISFTVIFHVLFFMFFWSLLTSIFADPGKIPKNWVNLLLVIFVIFF